MLRLWVEHLYVVTTGHFCIPCSDISLSWITLAGKHARTGLLPDFLLTLLCLFLPRANVLGSRAALLCRGKALIICLLQDGKTAEDLAKSEQHEHVAGLLARLRKVSLHLTSFIFL